MRVFLWTMIPPFRWEYDTPDNDIFYVSVFLPKEVNIVGHINMNYKKGK